jgi:hypothetical protein
MTRLSLLVLLAFGALSSGARARDDRAAAEQLRDEVLTPPAERYKVQFEPAAFYASPGGKVFLPGAPAGVGPVKLETVDLDIPRMSPFAELHVRSDNWRLTASGFGVRLSNRESVQTQSGSIGSLAFNPGDTLSSSMTFASGEIVAAHGLPVPASIDGTKHAEFAVGLEAYGGVRFYDVTFDFEGTEGSAHADEFFVQPIGGLKLTLSIIDQFTIDAQVGAGAFSEGGSKTSTSFDILVGFMWRPVHNVGVQIGYRLFIYDLKDGQSESRFQYEGAVAGIYGGIVVRF